MEQIKKSEVELSDEEVSSFLGKSAVEKETKAWLTTTFSNEAEALALRHLDQSKPFSEFWHASVSSKFFGLRIMRAHKATGVIRMTWICRHRDAEGKDQKTSIGPARRGTMEEAMLEALHLRKDAQMRRAMGISNVPTFSKAYETYMSLGSKRWSKATVRIYEKAYRNLKELAPIRCDKISSDKCEEIVGKIEKKVRARYKTFKNPTVELTGESSAREAMRLVRAIYADLMADGTVKFSPVARLQRKKFFEQEDTRVDAIHKDELPAVWTWLHTSAHSSVRDFVLFAIFTGFRLSVLGSLEKSRIDERRRTYLVKATDQGNKSRKAFNFPLNDFVWDTIVMPRLSDPHGHPRWLIESPKKAGKPLKSIRGTLTTMKNKTDVAVSPHGLRRTGATIMATVAGETYSARFLTHQLDATTTKGRNTSSYIVTTENDLRDACNKMAKYVLELVHSKKAPV